MLDVAWKLQKCCEGVEGDGGDRKPEPCISYDQTVCLLVPVHRTVSKQHKLGSQNLHRQIPQELSFREKVHPEILKDLPPARALNESGVGQICNFQPVSRHISETVQDRAKVNMNKCTKLQFILTLMAKYSD